MLDAIGVKEFITETGSKSESIIDALAEYGDSYYFWLIHPDSEPRRYEITGVPPVKWFKGILEKLSNFDNLKNNWDDDGALEIDLDAILAAIKLLAQIVKEETPEPYVFPTVIGGIQIEWHTEKADLEIEIESNRRIIVIFENEIGEQKDWEQDLYFDDLSTLIEHVAKLV